MRAVGLVLLYIFAVGVSQAAMVKQDVTYVLSDHPDSQLYKSHGVPYGLRLDSLGFADGGSGSPADRTFSTEGDDAFVTLIWSGSQVTISGAVVRNSDSSKWSIDYTLENVVGVPDADGGFKALLSEWATGFGEISNGDKTFFLSGKASGDTLFAALGDGHRCNGTNCPEDKEIGRGWMNVSNSHKYDITYGSNDWLVQLTPVPVPAALPLLVSGLLGFSFFSRKKVTGA